MNLELVSLLAPNADDFYKALARWLSDATGLGIHARSERPLAAREALVASSEPVVAALCGGLYAQRAAALGVEAVAAPVLRGRRYGGRPVFFSDLVVSRGSNARSLDDLRGHVFAVNDEASLSGFDVVRERLRADDARRFFRTVLVTGSHQASLDMVASGLAGAAAIDSGVLELELDRRPLLGSAVRVAATFGPLPSHPIAVRSSLPAHAKALVAGALAIAHGTSSGLAALRAGRVERFVAAGPALYEPLLEIAANRRCPASLAGADCDPFLRGCA